MSNIDQFESSFSAAFKPTYTYSPVKMRDILILTDLPADAGRRYVAHLMPLIGALSDEPRVRSIHYREGHCLADMVDQIRGDKPDVIITYRHLYSQATTFAYTLGSHLDVLTQATAQPILVTPRPEDLTGPVCEPSRTLIVTNCLTGDDKLINYGVGGSTAGADLFLAHIEDDRVYQQYLEIISKIPSINSEQAQASIAEQLLKEPSQYITSCQHTLAQTHPRMTCYPIVKLGHTVGTFIDLAREHGAELVVMHTKDQDQLAMHGLAYPLAIALRDIPLLML